MECMSDHRLVQALDHVDHSLALGIVNSFKSERAAADWIRCLAPCALGTRSGQLLSTSDPLLWSELAFWIRTSD
jgi:hypothetical protein